MLLRPAIAGLLQLSLIAKNPSFSGPSSEYSVSRFGSNSQHAIFGWLRVPQQDATPFTPGLDNWITETLDHYKVPGLAVAIINGNQTITRVCWSFSLLIESRAFTATPQGYGKAQFPDIPVTPETMFYSASTTKAFVAAALSLLVDDDDNSSHVKWTTPISQLIPDDFVLEDDYSTRHVTFEDAATHRTGMPRHDFSDRGGNQTEGRCTLVAFSAVDAAIENDISILQLNVHHARPCDWDFDRRLAWAFPSESYMGTTEYDFYVFFLIRYP
jgi:CubicO group peptidase (beta-lactamase class C family)